MQKKLIALAVAGLASTAAFAQTNVTIYGVADAGYVYSSGGRFAAARGDANFSGIQTGLLAGSTVVSVTVRRLMARTPVSRSLA